MSAQRKTRDVGVTKKKFEERILNRQDNIYNLRTISAIIDMYHEEIANAVEDGEKVNALGLGTFTPKLHSPKSVCPKWVDGEEDRRFQPYVSLRFVLSRDLKGKLNGKFRRNIENGIAGLSEIRMCDKKLVNTLISKGLLKAGGETDANKGEKYGSAR